MVFGLPEIPLLLKGTNNTLLLVTTTYLNFFFFKLIAMEMMYALVTQGASGVFHCILMR